MARIRCPLISNTSSYSVYRHGLVATFRDTGPMVQLGVLGRNNRGYVFDCQHPKVSTAEFIISLWVIRPGVWTHGTDTRAKSSTNMI